MPDLLVFFKQYKRSTSLSVILARSYTKKIGLENVIYFVYDKLDERASSLCIERLDRKS